MPLVGPMTVALTEPPEPDVDGPSAPSDVQAEAHLLSAVLRAGHVDTDVGHALVDDLATVVEPDDM